MRTLTVAITLLLPAPLALAHHSVTAFFDRSTTVEIEGTVMDVFWRNPHVGLTIEVVDEAGASELWELEGGAMNTLRRRGFSEASLSIGDHVRVAGSPSRRGEPAIFVSHFLLPSGEEVIFSDLDVAPRWTSPQAGSAAAGAAAVPPGFFKVWGYREFNRLRSPLALTPAAQAASDGFDPRADDVGLRCIPPGMPNAVLNPYPMELIDAGDRIVQRIEEWDARRVLYTGEDAPSADSHAPDYLGYSVARQEGNTLVITTTRIDFPLLDGDGTPMSADVEIVERYTLSDDESRLAYEIIVIDPVNLAEPAVWEGAWLYRPGVEVQPFECTLPETLNPVYR